MIAGWLTALRASLGLLARRVVAWPPPGAVRFGSLFRTRPISSRFGLDRGQPLDRFYIGDFLRRHQAEVRGWVLEFGDDRYTREFGGRKVTRGDVLHPAAGHPGATICGDLVSGDGVPSAAFDAVICTQVLQFVFDLRAAVATLHRCLVPGGVLLGTVPVVSMISPTDAAEFGEFWRFTVQGVRQLLVERFGDGNVTVEGAGNVLAATAFLHGLAAEEIPSDRLREHDPAYPVIVAFSAVRR